MYKVKTHDNSREYFESLNIKDDELYICPNTNFSFMIRERIGIDIEQRWRIIDIETVLDCIYKKWNTKTNQIVLKAIIRNIILELMETAKGSFLEELKFFDDNINVLFEDIRFIAEAGIKKIKFKKSTETKEAIKVIYDKLLVNDDFKRISSELFSIVDLKVFYKKIKGYTAGEVRKIYFYNINNLNINRWIMIELLSIIGFEVEFRVPYFEGINIVNKCWTDIYGNKDIFSWEIEQGQKRDFNKFKYVNFLEGTAYTGIENEKVTTKTYTHISDLKKVINDRPILTLYKDSVKSCKDIEQDMNEIENCFETDIGRFFNALYKCRVKDNIVHLDFSTYRDIITSGWLERQEWNGIALFEYLNDNSAYFKDVKTIDEIIHRIEILKELEGTNSIFEEHHKNKIKEDEQKRLLLNPFRVFNYNNLEKYNVTATYMLTLTIKLRSFILKALRNNSDFVNVEEHFEVLKTIFKNKYIIDRRNNGTQKEVDCILRIWSVLNRPGKFLEEMHKEELLEHLTITLSFKNTEKKQEEKDFIIDQLEGFMYRNHILNSKDKKIIITDLSYKAYEKYIKSKNIYGKILTNNDMYEIINSSLGGKQLEYVNKAFNLKTISEKSAGYYLKFLLANLFINFDGEKELSWIEGLRDKDTKSIILKQIESIYSTEKEEIDILEGNILDDSILNVDESETEEIKVYDIDELKTNHTKYSEANYRDLDFCSRKFLYASIIDKHITYQSDFHNKLAFSGLLSVLKDSMKNSNEDIVKFIFPLFPQWQEVIKENTLRCEYGSKKIRDYKYFDGINYPKKIDTVYLLKSKYLITEKWKIKNRYNNGNFVSEEFYKSFLKDYTKDEEFNGGRHCMMCPYLKVCKKGVFAIDNR